MKIYVHGLGQSSESWKKTIIHLESSENIVCPDLCDMLRDDETNYNNLYKAFVSYCNSFNESLDLCGLSVGSVLALNYAVDYPEKVRSLILIAPQYRMPVRLLKFQNIVFRFMPDSAFRQTGFKKNDFIRLCSSMAKLDFSNCQVSCSTLIVCGEKDRANKKASYELSEMLNSRIVIIKHSGHEVNVDFPERLARVLNKFYKKMQKDGVV